MQNKNIILIIVIILLVVIAGYFLYQNRSAVINHQKLVACDQIAKICPDGSSVGRTGVNCNFADCPLSIGIVYKNSEFGFEITLPATWQGYTMVKQNWQGTAIDGSGKTYSGDIVVIKNPKTTSQQAYQDIPIMVFTTDMWKLVGDEKTATVAVSAAPIGPAKIGENLKYVFATPPRWYGFADAIDWQEAVDAVKTFKAF